MYGGIFLKIWNNFFAHTVLTWSISSSLSSLHFFFEVQLRKNQGNHKKILAPNFGIRRKIEVCFLIFSKQHLTYTIVFNLCFGRFMINQYQYICRMLFIQRNISKRRENNKIVDTFLNFFLLSKKWEFIVSAIKDRNRICHINILYVHVNNILVYLKGYKRIKLKLFFNYIFKKLVKN